MKVKYDNGQRLTDYEFADEIAILNATNGADGSKAMLLTFSHGIGNAARVSPHEPW